MVVVFVMGVGSKVISLFSRLRGWTGWGRVGEVIGSGFRSIGTAFSKIRLPTMIKWTGVGAFGLAIYDGVMNGFNAASDTIQDVLSAAGINISDGQSNMILVGIIVVSIVGIVLYIVRRKR